MTRDNLDNLVLLCHRHHHHLHQHGYQMIPQPDGTWITAQTTEPEPTIRSQRTARRPAAPRQGETGRGPQPRAP